MVHLMVPRSQVAEALRAVGFYPDGRVDSNHTYWHHETNPVVKLRPEFVKKSVPANTVTQIVHRVAEWGICERSEFRKILRGVMKVPKTRERSVSIAPSTMPDPPPKKTNATQKTVGRAVCSFHIIERPAFVVVGVDTSGEPIELDACPTQAEALEKLTEYLLDGGGR